MHQAIWEALTALQLDAALVRRYVDLTRDAVFYLDPHVCVHCRYRSTELLWQCPQCHEWNTFVEERIAPAKSAVEPGRLALAALTREALDSASTSVGRTSTASTCALVSS